MYFLLTIQEGKKMPKTNLINQLPRLLREGKINHKETMELLVKHLLENKRYYNIQNYDNEFISDLYVWLFDHQKQIFEKYDEKTSAFRTFLYKIIQSTAIQQIRSRSRNNISDNIKFVESINLYEGLVEDYQQLRLPEKNTKFLTKDSIPQLFEIQEFFKNSSICHKKNKALLIMALQSAWNISDYQIECISEYLKLDTEFFYKVIQFTKNNISETMKFERRNTMEERRTANYFYHKKYCLELENLENKNLPRAQNFQLDIKAKQSKHESSWKKMNSKFQAGFLSLKPSNNLIAQMCGISERQIYYILQNLKSNPKMLNEYKKIFEQQAGNENHKYKLY